jgi:hypothetical protein
MARTKAVAWAIGTFAVWMLATYLLEVVVCWALLGAVLRNAFGPGMVSAAVVELLQKRLPRLGLALSKQVPARARSSC